MRTTPVLRTRTFVWTKQACDCGKEKCTNVRTGWKPEGTDEQFYPGPGHMVYHDTVEHFGNSEGWDRELLAFGATMYGRMHYDQAMMEVNAQDFVGFFHKDQKYTVPPCHGIYCNKRLEDDKDAEGFLQMYMQEIRDLLAKCQDPLYAMFTGAPYIELPYGQAELEKNLRNAEQWFRRGWWLARRLNHKQDFNAMIRMMRKMTKEVDGIIQFDQPKVGDKITVNVDRAHSTYTITKQYA